MCTCLYICLYIERYIYIYTHEYVCTREYEHISIHIYIYIIYTKRDLYCRWTDGHTCIHVYIYMICTCICIQMPHTCIQRSNMHMFAHISLRWSAHAYIYIYILLRIYINKHRCACPARWICLHISVCIYIHMNICTYIYGERDRARERCIYVNNYPCRRTLNHIQEHEIYTVISHGGPWTKYRSIDNTRNLLNYLFWLRMLQKHDKSYQRTAKPVKWGRRPPKGAEGPF